jgi:hypothetical protein
MDETEALTALTVQAPGVSLALPTLVAQAGDSAARYTPCRRRTSTSLLHLGVWAARYPPRSLRPRSDGHDARGLQEDSGLRNATAPKTWDGGPVRAYAQVRLLRIPASLIGHCGGEFGPSSLPGAERMSSRAGKESPQVEPPVAHDLPEITRPRVDEEAPPAREEAGL